MKNGGIRFLVTGLRIVSFAVLATFIVGKIAAGCRMSSPGAQVVEGHTGCTGAILLFFCVSLLSVAAAILTTVISDRPKASNEKKLSVPSRLG